MTGWGEGVCHVPIYSTEVLYRHVSNLYNDITMSCT